MRLKLGRIVPRPRLKRLQIRPLAKPQQFNSLLGRLQRTFGWRIEGRTGGTTAPMEASRSASASVAAFMGRVSVTGSAPFASKAPTANKRRQIAIEGGTGHRGGLLRTEMVQVPEDTSRKVSDGRVEPPDGFFGGPAVVGVVDCERRGERAVSRDADPPVRLLVRSVEVG